MKKWIISDTHFLHENIKKYCGRTDGFNKEIIKNWNSVIGKDDAVFHLGDLAAGLGRVENGYEKLKKIMNMLNGNIVLIRGNHDYFEASKFKRDLNIKAVTDYHIEGEFFMCHYPLIIDSYMKNHLKPIVESLTEAYKQSGCKYIVHGHSHLTKFGGNRINVSVDLTGMKPILFENLLDYK